MQCIMEKGSENNILYNTKISNLFRVVVVCASVGCGGGCESFCRLKVEFLFAMYGYLLLKLLWSEITKRTGLEFTHTHTSNQFFLRIIHIFHNQVLKNYQEKLMMQSHKCIH